MSLRLALADSSSPPAALAEQVARIGYIPIAVSVFSMQRPKAQRFIDFLAGPEGQAMFKKWHCLTSVEEARKLTRPDAPVGGEWTLPEGW